MKRINFSLFIILILYAWAASAPLQAQDAAEETSEAASTEEVAPRRGFAVIFGKIDRIEEVDATKKMLYVRNDIDNSYHTITITPWTNVTKITNIDEVKQGDMVRVMIRKVEDSELAMTVVFGNVKRVVNPRALQRPRGAAQDTEAPSVE